jgi:AcrR family transcriptional regulator
MEVKDARVAQGEVTQKLLREQARKLFAQKGYSGANTSELVELAQVTKGALYHHFENKRELYLAVVEDMESELVERIEAAGAAVREPWKRLRAMCRAYLDCCRDPSLTRILVLEAPLVLGWKTWCSLEQKYEVEAFARCLKDAGAAGFTPAAPPEAVETLAQVILGALTTGARVIATAADPDAARKQVEKTIQHLLAGLHSNAR